MTIINDNSFLSTRQLKSQDRLTEQQYRDLAGIIYDTDKYIFPALFEENEAPREGAIDLISYVIKNGTDEYFNKKNLFVCFKDSEIVGMVLWTQGTIHWNYEKFVLMGEEIGVTVLPENARKVNQAFFGDNNGSNLSATSNVITLVNVCVHHNYRGKRIGTFMLDEFVSLYGKNEMELCVLKDNPPAVSLYKKHGFVIISEFPGFSQTTKKPMCYGMKRLFQDEVN